MLNTIIINKDTPFLLCKVLINENIWYMEFSKMSHLFNILFILIFLIALVESHKISLAQKIEPQLIIYINTCKCYVKYIYNNKIYPCIVSTALMNTITFTHPYNYGES